jgi:hypothetical protein
MNWTGVSFTPGGGSPTPITGVTNVAIATGATMEKFAGDGDRYNSTVVNSMNDPTVTITTADQQTIRQWPGGTRGTLTFTQNDAKNAATAGGGAVLFTVSNAIVQDTPTGGAHARIDTGSISFCTESSDGQTPPISSAAA